MMGIKANGLKVKVFLHRERCEHSRRLEFREHTMMQVPCKARSRIYHRLKYEQ